MTLLWRCATVSLVLVASTLLLAAAQQGETGNGVKKAVCVLKPTQNYKGISGVVTFTQKGGVIEVEGKITGLTPGKHGFHVHEFGDLNSPDGMATGGHFNPDKAKHGGPHEAVRHVGDLGNIEADGEGKAVIKMTDKLLALSGKHSIIGRALIVHAKEDDLTSQPSGDAGGRIAQGVIGIAK
jgi:Cu-Zn family superoxide dismutase